MVSLTHTHTRLVPISGINHGGARVVRNNEQASVARDPLSVPAGKRVARKVAAVVGISTPLFNPESATKFFLLLSRRVAYK